MTAVYVASLIRKMTDEIANREINIDINISDKFCVI
jgi:hypothetical protein